MKLILIFLLITFSSLAAFAQSDAKKGDSFSEVMSPEKFSIKSVYAVNREYIMDVTYAMNSIVPGETYPVLYYTDGWVHSDVFNQNGFFLGYGQEIEPVILVGISFKGDLSDWGTLRSEDFVPNIKDPNTSSGANRFLDFIKNELIPYVEQNYPVDTSDRGIYGYSLGGLFAAWVLKEEPKLFQRYGIGSPSLRHQDFALLKDQTFLKNIENLKDVKIYIEYASLEGEPHKSGVESFVEIIKTNKSIEWKKFVIDGSHLAANPTSCVKALSYLYAKER